MITVLIVGVGERGSMFANYISSNGNQAKVIAVCEISQKKRDVFALRHNIPNHHIYSNHLQITSKIANVAFICTQDDSHAEITTHLASLHFDGIFCEKPMATTLQACTQMRDAIKSNNIIFAVGHVLRYSPYTRCIQRVIQGQDLAVGEKGIGEIVNISHVEPVGWYHFAHSYVRGNWASESKCGSPSLLAKSCHDLDLLLHYMHPKQRAVKVSSFGSLHHFKKSKKPKEAGGAVRCDGCPIENTCAYSATTIYVKSAMMGNSGWPVSVVCGEDIEDLYSSSSSRTSTSTTTTTSNPLVDLVKHKLSTTSYGKCVYESDNDVCDHQIVNIQFESGATASFTMVAFTESIGQRQTRLHGTKGEITGDSRGFKVFDFESRRARVVSDPVKELRDVTPSNSISGHGGGDHGIAEAFLRAVAARDQSILGCTVDDVFDSHVLVFAAEASRKEGRVIDIQEFLSTSSSSSTVV